MKNPRLTRKKLDELRARMMDHAVVGGVALVIVSARELDDLLTAVELTLRVPACSRVALTPGDAVRVARESQEWTRKQLAAASLLPLEVVSNIEDGRVTLNATDARRLARALGVHPHVLRRPNWPSAK